MKIVYFITSSIFILFLGYINFSQNEKIENLYNQNEEFRKEINNLNQFKNESLKDNYLENKVSILEHIVNKIGKKVIKEKNIDMNCREDEIIFDSNYGFKACIPNNWYSYNQYTGARERNDLNSNNVGYVVYDKNNETTLDTIIYFQESYWLPDSKALWGLKDNGYYYELGDGYSRKKYYLFGTRVIRFDYNSNIKGHKRFFETVTSKY